MTKKVLAFLMATMMILSFCAVSAFAADDEAIFEVTSLGIMKGDGDGNLRLEDDVTRGEFATMVTRLLGYEGIVMKRETVFSDVPENHVHSGAIALISEFGYIQGDGNGYFYPDSPITVQDCLKILVCATGYELEAQRKGGYPAGYIAVATKFEMTKGLERTIRENATRGDVVNMIYHALYVDLLEPYVTSGGQLTLSGETFKDRFASLEDIHHITGIVTANYDTWLVAPSSDIERDEIEVDGVRYTSGKLDTREYLGRLVELYYREEASGEKTVLNIALSTKNREFVVDSDDFASISETELNYRDSKNKKQVVKLNSDVVYIYNNRVLTQYEDSNLEIAQGRYIGVSNNNDDKCEYLFIYDYKASIVDRVNLNGCIYLKTTLPIYGSTSIVVDEEEDNDVTLNLMDVNGNAITINEVKAGNIVTAYRSLDGSVMDVVISDKFVEGKIEEFTDDGDVLIGGSVLGLSAEVNSEELLLGNEVIAYVNEFDKIVYLEKTDDSAYKYGYILEAGNGGFGGSYQVKVLVAGALTESSEIEEGEETEDEEETVAILLCNNSEVLYTSLAEKVKYDGEKVSAADVVDDIDESYPVKFKTNGNGEISVIEKLDRTAGLDIESATTSMTGLYFNSEDGTFYNNNSSAVVPFGVNSGTKVICVPTNETNASDINYSATEDQLLSLIRISPQSKNILHVSGYEIDEETNCVKLLVVKNIMEESMSAQENVRTSSDVALVKAAYTRINEDDEEVKAVTLLTKSGEVDLAVASSRIDQSDNRAIKEGDFILYLLDNSGNIFSTKVIKSLGGGVTDGKTYPISTENTFASVTGSVQDITRLEINAVNGRRYHELQVLSGSTLSVSNFTLLSKPVVFIYNKSVDKMEIGEFDDIMHEDRVCVLANQSTTGNEVKAIVVVRGE